MSDSAEIHYKKRGDDWPKAGTKIAFSKYVEFTPSEIEVNGYRVQRSSSGCSVGFLAGGHGGTGPNRFRISVEEFESLARLAEELHASFEAAVRKIEKTKQREDLWRENT